MFNYNLMRENCKSFYPQFAKYLRIVHEIFTILVNDNIKSDIYKWVKAMKRSVCAAFSGLLCALGVVLLFLSGIVSVFAYLMPVLAGMLLIFSNAHFSAPVSLCIYAATAVLGLVLVPDHECALLYALFFGYYPVLFARLERLRPAVLRWGAKLLLFNAALTLCEWLLVVLFRIPFDDALGVWGIVLLYLLFNLLFVLYDRLFGRAAVLYDRRLKKRVARFLK